VKRILTKKQILLTVSLLLVLFLTVGGTLAYLLVKTDALRNDFDPLNVACQVNTSGSSTAYSGTVKNTGTADAYVRMAAAPSFANGTTIYYAPPTTTATYSTSDWILAADGFYYYNRVLVPGETTSAITYTLQGDVPAGYTYTVEFAGEAIQAEPPSVVQSVWPVSLNGTTLTPLAP